MLIIMAIIHQILHHVYARMGMVGNMVGSIYKLARENAMTRNLRLTLTLQIIKDGMDLINVTVSQALNGILIKCHKYALEIAVHRL